MTGTTQKGSSVATDEIRQVTSLPSDGVVPAPHFRCSPELTLEIVRGDSDFASRQVLGHPFFIGSDEDCELRLCHPAIPPVIAVIRVLEEGAWIESNQASPAMAINQQEVRQSWLRDGDEIGLGPFVIRAHLGLKVNSSQLSLPLQSSEKLAQRSPVTCDETGLGGSGLEALNASDLLDRIETELEMIESDEGRRREGEDTLLRAILARQAALQLNGPGIMSQEEDPPPHRISIRLRREERENETPAEITRTLVDDLGQVIAELSRSLEAYQLPPSKLVNSENSLSGSSSDEFQMSLESVMQQLNSLKQRTSNQQTPRAIA